MFDCSNEIIGTKVGKLKVQSLEELDSMVEKHSVELAIVAVPAEAASAVSQRLEAAGITGILNFAPVTVRSPNSSLTVVDVDLAVELQRLAFAVVNGKST